LVAQLENKPYPLDEWGIYVIVPNHYIQHTVSPDIPGTSNTYEWAPLLTSATPLHPYGLVVFWLDGTMPQQGLTPARIVSRIDIYDPVSGELISSISPTIPCPQTEEYGVTPNYLDGSIISPIQPNCRNEIIGLNYLTGSIAWSYSTSDTELAEAFGTILLSGPPSVQGCPSLTGIDAASGRTLFADNFSTLTDTTPGAMKGCWEDSIPTVNDAWCGVAEVDNCSNTVLLSSSSYGRVLNVRTGRVTTPPPAADYENKFLYSDGRSKLVVTQAAGNSQNMDYYFVNLGGIGVYSVPQWKVVLEVSAATIDKEDANVRGLCGGQILLLTTGETTVISAYNRSALWSGPDDGMPGLAASGSNIGSVQCGPGWILVTTFGEFVQPGDLWLLRSGASLASAMSSLLTSVGPPVGF
jgi:hypothetical protein